MATGGPSPIPFAGGYPMPHELSPAEIKNLIMNFAEAAQRALGAVGLITNAQQAEQTLVCGNADAVFLGRAVLRDPYWPLHAA